MTRYFINALFFILLFSCSSLGAQPFYYEEEDKEILNRYFHTMEEKKNIPFQKLLVETAFYFLETPYAAFTLEQEPEGLVVNLREMDCLTFVENVICLTRTLKEDKPSFDSFCRHLQRLRYREGIIKNYTDRLHYTSDWIYENEQKGLLKDITKEIGGEPLSLFLSYMSTHPDSYKQLKGNKEWVEVIEKKEKEISFRSHYYIKKEKINDFIDDYQSGDIVGFVTTIEGLDTTHVGFIYKENDILTFIHASSTEKKVIINNTSLENYTQRIHNNKGILVIRAQK